MFQPRILKNVSRKTDGPPEKKSRIDEIDEVGDSENLLDEMGKSLQKIQDISQNYVSNLKNQFTTANKTINDMKTPHAKEKAQLEMTIKNLKAEIERLNKNKKTCSGCNKQIETISFCNESCYEKSLISRSKLIQTIKKK